jgi:HCOMODA/2-hydroxy-3-carboxy-muconic semialdehyde decarboxylase
MQLDVPLASAELRADLADANQILFDQDLNDGFGHISVRHDADPGRYVMMRNLEPGIVDPDSVIEFDLESRPIPGRTGSCKERFIHGEIYKARPDVGAIVHTHAVPLVLFSVIPEALRPLSHMAYFLNEGAPSFEIRDVPDPGDLLITTEERGKALALALAADALVLMRGHGASVVGKSLREVMYRTIYAAQNAQMQCAARQFGSPTFLNRAEIAASDNENAYEKAWRFWKRRAKRGWPQ